MQNNTFSGLFVGQNIVTLKSVNSTNTWLKEALSNSTPLTEGTVILAEDQFAGRGQINTAWVSQPGKNLIFSILLNPRFLKVNEQFALNMAISLAINDILRANSTPAATIKWPNDSYVGDEKIGGVLIENIVLGNLLKHAIVGIGLNVNQVSFPPNIKNVTSLKKNLHTDYDLTTLLGEICNAVEARYLQLRAGKKKELRKEYLNKLYGINEWRNFKADGKVKPGKIYGVSAEGYLQVEMENGTRQFGLKEIEFILP